MFFFFNNNSYLLKQFLVIVFAFLVSSMHAQNVNLAWVKDIGGTSDDQGNSIAVDALGNIYATGFYSGTVDFDPSLVVNNLTAVGLNDVFVSKFDALGNLVWIKTFGGVAGDAGISILLDSTANVYVSGNFNGVVDFNPSTSVYNLNSGNNEAVFILKLNSLGNFIWANAIGGSNGYINTTSMSLDHLGNLHATGVFSGVVDFDPGLIAYDLISSNVFDLDAYILKLDFNGNFVWAKSIGETGYILSNSITVDAESNVYTTGYYAGLIDFDPDTGIYILNSSGFADIYISKLDPNGNFVWVKNISSDSAESGRSICSDNLGNVYITGSYQGTLDFDPSSSIFNLSPLKEEDVFILKLDTSGNFIWAKSIGGNSYDLGSNIVTDSYGNVYISGDYSDTVDFDPGLGTFQMIASIFVNEHCFLLKLDTAGSFVWAKTIGGFSGLQKSIAIDNFENVYSIGGFTGAADFDPDTTAFMITSSGLRDIYIHKMNNQSLNLAKEFKFQSVDVYPNPFNGKFTIINTLGVNNRLAIYNIVGKRIYQSEIKNQKMEVDLSQQPNGIYFIKYGSLMRKIIKK